MPRSCAVSQSTRSVRSRAWLAVNLTLPVTHGCELHPDRVRGHPGRNPVPGPGDPEICAALQPGLGDVLDDQAREAYRRRLSDIERDLTEAEDWSDVGRLDALHAERDALVGELAAATGLGGRARVTGSSHERARVAATKAITAAIDRIATVDAPLGRHLRATIRTGLHCSYQPAPDDERDWILYQK